MIEANSKSLAIKGSPMAQITEFRQSAQHTDWSAVYVVGLTTFAVVTTEMLPIGMMMPIAKELDISLGTAGLIISVPALLAAFFAPMVVLMAGEIDRRRILVGLLMLLTVANLASALSPSYEWLLVARVIVGFCMGGIWAVAGGLAPKLVPTQSIGVATAIIFGGVAAASVVGVPLGVLISDIAEWRGAFAVMAGFSLMVFGLGFRLLPALRVNQSVRASQMVAELKRPRVQAGLFLTLLLVTGHFIAYAFVGSILEVISGVKTEWIGMLLFIYGAAGIIGNFLAGRFASARLGMTLGTIIFSLLIAIPSFAFVGEGTISAAEILILWGGAYGGVSVALQIWMMKAASTSIEITTALFVSVFNSAIALGALIGGQVTDRFGLHITLTVAAIFAALALSFLLLILRRN